MQQTLERTKEQQSLENFSELMQEVAKLPEDKRNIVAIYSRVCLLWHRRSRAQRGNRICRQ